MNKWSAEKRPPASRDNGTVIALRHGKQPLRFTDLFELLATNRDFSNWYSSVLRHSGYPAYFWEHPPLTAANIAKPAEFVLLAAPSLDTLRPNPAAFAAHFNAARSAGNQTVASFRNIGGDALLIAPCPGSPSQPYTHLGSFICTAPTSQIEEFWRVTAGAVMDNLGDQPLWLSTSGLGVAWLHVRLDSRPKYYQYRTYAVID